MFSKWKKKLGENVSKLLKDFKHFDTDESIDGIPISSWIDYWNTLQIPFTFDASQTQEYLHPLKFYWLSPKLQVFYNISETPILN